MPVMVYIALSLLVAVVGLSVSAAVATTTPVLIATAADGHVLVEGLVEPVAHGALHLGLLIGLIMFALGTVAVPALCLHTFVRHPPFLVVLDTPLSAHERLDLLAAAL